MTFILLAKGRKASAVDFARYMRRGAADKPFGGVAQALKTVAMRKLPRYRWHLGCILLKMAAISLPTGGGRGHDGRHHRHLHRR